MKKKVVIHPLGFYEPWSLEQKKIKKKLAWFFYQKKILKKADLIHCASNIEQINLLKLDRKFKTKILPYGIPNIFFNRGVKKKLNKKAIFFSRIHPKKGLEDLITQWIKIDNKIWELDIYGPCEDKKYYDYLRSILKKNKTNAVKFFKPIYSDKAKINLFKKYDFYILPTKNENFSLSIAEALASSLPVLTNKNAPWKSIKKNNAGWFIGTSSLALNQTLRKIFNLKYSDFFLKAKNAFNLSQSYNWKVISSDYIKEYDKLIKL
jgi:glycosyltransferase involved in cell wall biosynthesis